MRVTAIETIHVDADPNITLVEVHTDAGISGLGETFRGPQAVVAQIHEAIAPCLLGRDRALGQSNQGQQHSRGIVATQLC